MFQTKKTINEIEMKTKSSTTESTDTPANDPTVLPISAAKVGSEYAATSFTYSNLFVRYCILMCTALQAKVPLGSFGHRVSRGAHLHVSRFSGISMMSYLISIHG